MKRSGMSNRSKAAIVRLAIFAVLLATAAFATACSEKNAFADSEGKVKVTATTGMIADTVRQVGGERVAVIGLMGPGTDPHLYKASQGDIAKLDQADLIFYNGLHLEGKMQSLFEKMAAHKPVIAVSDNIDRSALLSAGDGQYDPHIWFDVRLWMTVTETIRDALAEFDQTHAEHYRKNAEAYLQQLENLHRETAEKIGSVPEKSRVLVTAHDAFGYFGKAYGIKVVGLQGISTASEAGAKDVSDLRDFLVENGIKAIFVESSVPRKAIEAVIQGAKQKGHEVKIGGELFSDAMGAEGTPEGTYIGMMRHNVNTIVEALK